MRTFPHNDCPTAGALLAYLEGHAEPDLRACIEAHLQHCEACREALTTLRAAITASADSTVACATQADVGSAHGEDFTPAEPPPAEAETHADVMARLRQSLATRLSHYGPDAERELHERLTEQRAVDAGMLAPFPTLGFGQVWAVKPHRQTLSYPARDKCDWLYSDGAAFSFLGLVLSHHTSTVDNTALVNVAPLNPAKATIIAAPVTNTAAPMMDTGSITERSPR